MNLKARFRESPKMEVVNKQNDSICKKIILEEKFHAH